MRKLIYDGIHEFTTFMEYGPNFDEIDIRVEFEYESAGGDGWNEPHHEESIDILEVVIDATNEIITDKISKTDKDRLEEKALDHINDNKENDQMMALECREAAREMAHK